MKIGQLIEYNEKYFSLNIMQKTRQGDLFYCSGPLIIFLKSLVCDKRKWSLV